MRKKFLAAHKAGIGSLVDSGLAGDRQSESIAKLGYGLNGITTEQFAQEHDDVGEICFGDVDARPECGKEFGPGDQTAVVADQQMQCVKSLGVEESTCFALKQPPFA